MQLIAADGGLEIATYCIRHIAGGVVHDILCIVFDGAVFRGIGDIELILLCRGLTVFTLDGFIISLCRIDGTIGILTIFVFQICIVFAGGLRSRAGVAILVCDDIFGLCLRLCAVVRVVQILHVIHDDIGSLLMEALIARDIILHVIRDHIRCLLMEALFARYTIGKPDFVFFCIKSGRAGNRFSCPIDFKILRGYFAMIDFSVVIGRFVPENHLVRGDSTSDFQIAADGRIPCGRDRFSRQPLHIFDIALLIHFDTVFDGGLSLLRVTFDTAGAFICFHDFIGICFGLIIKFDQIIRYILVFLDIVAIYSQFTDRRFSIRYLLLQSRI